MQIPADDASFDIVYTWSAFEHVADPPALLREIRRIMEPQGTLMLQLWPFYYSARGSHLWDWFPEPFHHLLEPAESVVASMRASDRHEPDETARMAGEFLRLNRITPDDLHRSILAAGLELRKLEVLGGATHLPSEANRYPLTQLGVSGVKLLAGVAAATRQ